MRNGGSTASRHPSPGATGPGSVLGAGLRCPAARTRCYPERSVTLRPREPSAGLRLMFKIFEQFIFNNIVDLNLVSLYPFSISFMLYGFFLTYFRFIMF